MIFANFKKKDWLYVFISVLLVVVQVFLDLTILHFYHKYDILIFGHRILNSHTGHTEDTSF